MRILITGATGLIGRAVSEHLFEQGHDLVILSRNPDQARETLLFPAEFVRWDASKEAAPASAFKGVESVIHLAGESIAGGRWTEQRKKEILNSRVEGTRNLILGVKDALSQGFTQSLSWIGASAIGYYGNRGDEEISEESQRGFGFLSDVCAAWEQETTTLPSSVRVVNLRIGIVLSSQGGALEKILPPFVLGVGGKIGDGKQWMSWIHIADLVGLIDFSIQRTELHGVMNATAPQPVTNEEFSSALGKVLNRKSWLPVPAIVLKVALGEMSDLVLGGAKVLPARAMALSYPFKFVDLQAALSDVVPHEGDTVFERAQFIPSPLPKVFEFFSDAKNLEALTPSFLNFKILNVSTPHIERGTLIDYQLTIRGVPVKWRTEIEEWNPPLSFVDNQLKGPYQKWHHTHTFKELKGGTWVKDRVLFKLPGERFGKVLGEGFVKGDVVKIFKYRASELKKQFSVE